MGNVRVLLCLLLCILQACSPPNAKTRGSGSTSGQLDAEAVLGHTTDGKTFFLRQTNSLISAVNIKEGRPTTRFNIAPTGVTETGLLASENMTLSEEGKYVAVLEESGVLEFAPYDPKDIITPVGFQLPNSTIDSLCVATPPGSGQTLGSTGYKELRAYPTTLGGFSLAAVAGTIASYVINPSYGGPFAKTDTAIERKYYLDGVGGLKINKLALDPADPSYMVSQVVEEYAPTTAWSAVQNMVCRPAQVIPNKRGPKSPTNLVNVPAPGTIVSWGTMPGAKKNDDTSFAIAPPNPPNAFSNYLVAKGFFTSDPVPATAVIDGIVTEYDLTSNHVGCYVDKVRIVKGGVLGNEDRANYNSMPGVDTDTYLAFGASNDTWLVNDTWTPAEINSPEFGVALSVYLDAGAGREPCWVKVDHVRVTVHYH